MGGITFGDMLPQLFINLLLFFMVLYGMSFFCELFFEVDKHE